MDYIKETILAFLGGMTLLQISPIKIDPWTWLARFIGRAINSEIMAEVKELNKRMDKAEEKAEEREIKNARIRILRFGDECKNNVDHSEEHFDQILEDINCYEVYCSEHPEFKNNKAKLTIEIIKDSYQRRLLKNDFLVNRD